MTKVMSLHRILFALVVLFVAPAKAEPPDASVTAEAPAGTPFRPLGESLTGQAKASYEAGRLLHADGDFAGAGAKFKHAYELSKDPRLLWNMAACEKQQRHYARASTLIERYLSEGGARLSTDSRRNAEELLHSLAAFSSPITLVGVPAGAAISVDGQKVAQAPLASPLYLDLGLRQLTVVAPGYLPFQRSLDVKGGVPETVQVTLQPDTTSARLTISTTPGATIRIDGKYMGQGTWEGTVPAGAHTIRITAKDKEPYEARLDLAAKSQRTLQVTLEKERGAPAWPWIAGGGVVATGATIALVVLLSSQTQVQGPEGSLGTLPGYSK